MALDENSLEIRAFSGSGYAPLVDFSQWRVALLRFIDELLPERLDRMQRHDQTDEVFVLLAGRCILFLGDGRETAGTIHAVDMEPQKIYNVKRGCWHTHTLSRDASVLIIENRDTTAVNSPTLMLDGTQQSLLVDLTGRLWNKPSPSSNKP
jgi:ureidoglycolate hydrolase